MSAADLREIFKRLNRNVIALNRQELRHATYWGEFITMMERIADRPFWTDAGVFTPNAVRRMLDVEFVSELTIALLHGVQNKKESLDDWYQAYAESFPDAARVVFAFDRTLGELREVVPEFHGTRWRKKSDFYTLFLATAARLEAGNPIDRAQARTRLEQFQAEVTEVLKNSAAKVPTAVRDYAGAVERAASDRANRRTRLSRLKSYLEWE
tara:strand:+ start:51 stop:683 length:633 start_codon:yes stop_codon:yes gene_type:complete